MLLVDVLCETTPDDLSCNVNYGVILALCHYLQMKRSFNRKHRRDRLFAVAPWAANIIAAFFEFVLFGEYVVCPLLGLGGLGT